ncbi:glycosyltransferase family 2 protein [Pusillimonas caeni]|uniref:glycosyltransferase family 2 protein n=1 Tax=Pusillimonas caeni TaxID=1348472 RepID=UPI000E59C62A|nr:glycosyltransferase family A protein [Pusillimonas caeni]TFL14265.1 glycosyltransferase family 2 protein [Pusillimonas caeni]
MTTFPRPLVSVVIPTYGRPDLLERCLDAVMAQSLPASAYEVIVCDDGPSEAVDALVRRKSAGMPAGPALRYCAVRATQGPAGARNAGWQMALAPLIAFTDDDTVPTRDWLVNGLEAMKDGAGAAAGRIVMPLPERATDSQRDAARLQQAEFVTANCFVRVEALRAVGGFDERYTIAWREDSDLHFALLERGFEVIRADAAVVLHPLRDAPFAAGIGSQRKIMFDVLLYRKYPKLYRQRIRAHWPWLYLAISACLIVAAVSFLAGRHGLALAAALAWLLLSTFLFFRRLSGSAPTLRNLGELLLTTAVIPPLSIYWRLRGASRFGPALP